jgi:hypothetical protein
MKLEFVIFFNILTGAIFIINLIYMLIKFYRNIQLEQASYIGQESNSKKDYMEASVEPIILDQLRILRTKYYISFILAETSLIIFFVFWCIVLFYKIPIT